MVHLLLPEKSRGLPWGWQGKQVSRHWGSRPAQPSSFPFSETQPPSYWNSRLGQPACSSFQILIFLCLSSREASLGRKSTGWRVSSRQAVAGTAGLAAQTHPHTLSGGAAPSTLPCPSSGARGGLSLGEGATESQGGQSSDLSRDEPRAGLAGPWVSGVFLSASRKIRPKEQVPVSWAAPLAEEVPAHLETLFLQSPLRRELNACLPPAPQSPQQVPGHSTPMSSCRS